MKVIDNGIFNLIVSGNVACMDFNPTGNRYPSALVDVCFEKECKYLTRFVNYAWCPEVTAIDCNARKIYLHWYNNTCEEALSTDWKNQLEIIVTNLADENVYKPSFYPRFFYVDDQDNLRAYAFYSTSDQHEQPIAMAFYQPILNAARAQLVNQLTIDGKLDMAVLLKYAFTDYIKWPDDVLPEIYRRVYQSPKNSH